MKIRTDFVTNSSSSSFIISTNEIIDERFKSYFTRITEDNAIHILDEDYDADWIMDREFKKDEIQKLGNFNEEQLKIVWDLVAAAYCDKLQEYLNLRKDLKDNASPIYHVSYENNLPWTADIYNYIQSITDKEQEEER